MRVSRWCGILAMTLAGGCARGSDVPSPLLTAMMASADSLHLDGSFDSARVIWTRVLELGRDAALPEVQGRALTGLGLAAYRTGVYDDARRHLRSALELQHREGLDDQMARAYNALGLVAYQQGRLLEAAAFYDSSLRAARAVADTQGIARAVGNLGLVRFELGEFDAARDGFETMRDAGAGLADARMHGNALNNLGMLDVRLGNARAALAALAEARRQYRSIDYRTGEQNNLGQLATAYAAIGEIGRAFAVLDSALRLSRELGLRQEVASNLEVLASLHQGAGDARRALRLYEEAQVINQELGLEVERGSNARNRAILLRELGRLDAADALVRESLRIHRDGGAKGEELHDLLLMADIEHARGRPAARWLAEADSLAARLGAGSARTHVSLTRARIADEDGDPDAVLRALAAGPDEWERTGFAGLAEGYLLRARAHGRRGDLDRAIADGRQGVAAADRLRAGLGSTELRARMAGMYVATHSDLVAALVRRGMVAEAFEVADAARGRTLLEHLEWSGRGELADDASQVLRREELLRRISELMASRTELDADGDAGREVAAALERRIADARSQYEALVARAATAPPSVLGATRRVGTAQGVQSSLASDEVLLEYLIAPDRIHIFVVSRERLEHLTRALTIDELSRTVRVAHDLLSRQPGDRDAAQPTAALAALHRMLVAPARAFLPEGSRLIIVSHGILGRVPFAALRDERGRSLVERHSVLEVPSGAALRALRARAVDARVGFVASVFAPLPATLPGSAREAAAVARATGGGRPNLGPDATERRLRAALAAGGIVHVATHGRLNDRNPIFSRLELHAPPGSSPDDDGRLEVHELFGQRLGGTLVFLSGCETGAAAGISPYQGGEEYAALAQILLHAGVRNVVATSWKIDDDAAEMLAERFYAHLPGRSPADALAAAQRDMLRSPRFADPRYWAAYKVAGDGRPIVVRRDGAAGGR